ncbi:MAG: bifunctional transaldolase/phosoglucose isomerase [Nitrospirota bacterium]
MNPFNPLYELRYGRAEVDAKLAVFLQQDFVKRLWEKDPTIWHKGPAHHRIIQNALGWLHVVDQEIDLLPKIKTFVASVQAEGFKDVLLLGMGGSSLSPEVFRMTFGIVPGFPKLYILDSTIPDQIKQIERQIDLEKTLFIVSSKSGSTIETLMLYRYFFHQMQKMKGDTAGTHFVAITDPSSPLHQIALKDKFRDLFFGVPDIGGRYSALSNFGIVPAALMGVDVDTLLHRAKAMIKSCGPDIPLAENPGVLMGVTLAELAKLGRDKLTFITSPAISAFSAWLEQLIAESTGKEEIGIIPIADEPLGNPTVYGYDRLFVYIHYVNDIKTEADKMAVLNAAGYPMIVAEVSDLLNLGQAFFLWEIATVIAGSLLRINPFDQPNVQESKENTQALLEGFKINGRLREEVPFLVESGLSVFCDYKNRERLKAMNKLSDVLAEHLDPVNSGDYVALNVYLERNDRIHQKLSAIRLLILDKKRVATTLNYGPRFLHSTGQLHKGGPDSGLFIQITADDSNDLAIPGEPFTFGLLKSAQAQGDFMSLIQHNRRILWIHLGSDVEAGLLHLKQAIADAI